jgi:hypothetical protein
MLRNVDFPALDNERVSDEYLSPTYREIPIGSQQDEDAVSGDIKSEV